MGDVGKMGQAPQNVRTEGEQSKCFSQGLHFRGEQTVGRATAHPKDHSRRRQMTFVTAAVAGCALQS